MRYPPHALAAAQERARIGLVKASNALRDAITATGMPTFQGVAILAVADTYAKAATLAVPTLPSADTRPAGDDAHAGMAGDA